MPENTGNTGNTGTQDVTYNIISIVYHALQGAETIEKYVRDAEQGGDQDLTQFFRETQDQYRQLADRGKQLLSQRISQEQSQAAGR